MVDTVDQLQMSTAMTETGPRLDAEGFQIAVAAPDATAVELCVRTVDGREGGAGARAGARAAGGGGGGTPPATSSPPASTGRARGCATGFARMARPATRPC